MPTISDDRFYANMLRNRSIEPVGTPPVFNLFAPHHDPGETSVALRTAFAFLRQRGDRRYSANSLIKLLNYADTLDRAASSGQTIAADEYPQVLIAEVPYHYDEETEVKQGGTVAVAVLLPDNRLMLATHGDRRRQKVGTGMYRFICRNHPSGSTPTVWVHQENQLGAMFCLSVGAMPRQMNNSGAVAYCERYIDGDADNMAVVETEEWVLNDAMEQQARRNRPSRAGRAAPTRAFPPDSQYGDLEAVNERFLNALDAPVRAAELARRPTADELRMTMSELRSAGLRPVITRNVEVCDDPDCNELACRNAHSESSTYEDVMDTDDYGWLEEDGPEEQWYDHVPPRSDSTTMSPFVLTTSTT